MSRTPPMRLRLALAAVLIASPVMAAGPIEVTSTVGPWKIGTLHDRIDARDTQLVSNIKDQYETLTFAFRCRDGRYDTLIFKRNGDKLFSIGEKYRLEWRLDRDPKIEGEATAIADAGLVMDKTLAMDQLTNRSELIIRVFLGTKKYDGVFSLIDSAVALRSISSHCKPV